MKKSLLTLSMLALFTVTANAQDDKKATLEKKPAKKEVVNDDGTTSVVEDATTSEPAKKEEPKKSGTRMAINEKGTGGTKTSTSKKETAKEGKTESPTSKPH
ncbi:MAG: hypothetical protein Q7W45_17545 [Bacteroidota bacterium]|nr:hypothetical protein [Bacteroidota bacterium]MDP3145178.1 hypothetical protein [Bacteroidota bacterium]MDP3557296.1 hypothetical protein [Bacteroidota bacterium]